MPEPQIARTWGDVGAVDSAVLRATGTDDVGVTTSGFVPKSFARLLAEKLALAQGVFGSDVDLTAGSVVRKLLEISALEDARTWAAVGAAWDDAFVTSATGEALSRLGAELSLPRPFSEAAGSVRLQLSGTLPTGTANVSIPWGSRLLTSGGHDVATAEDVVLDPVQPVRDVAVVAFLPGPEGDLDPAVVDAGGAHPQRIDRWNMLDDGLADYSALAAGSGVQVQVQHTRPLTGGTSRWPDDRYRTLLLRAPRSLWTADALQVAVSLVPGVRQVLVRDAWGGLDLDQSIFGNFSFLERVFSAERDLASPYYVTILVAPTPAAIWDGPEGLQAQVRAAVEDLRPLGIFPSVVQGETAAVSFAADVLVAGVPLPGGGDRVVNASDAAATLKQRLSDRVRRYVGGLSFGEPVRAAEVVHGLMDEPGVVDVRNLTLVRAPVLVDDDVPAELVGPGDDLVRAVRLGVGENYDVGASSIPGYVQRLDLLRLVTR